MLGFLTEFQAVTISPAFLTGEWLVLPPGFGKHQGLGKGINA